MGHRDKLSSFIQKKTFWIGLCVTKFFVTIYIRFRTQSPSDSVIRFWWNWLRNTVKTHLKQKNYLPNQSTSYGIMREYTQTIKWTSDKKLKFLLSHPWQIITALHKHTSNVESTRRRPFLTSRLMRPGKFDPESSQTSWNWIERMTPIQWTRVPNRLSRHEIYVLDFSDLHYTWHHNCIRWKQSLKQN